jgi:hypothetical protein
LKGTPLRRKFREIFENIKKTYLRIAIPLSRNNKLPLKYSIRIDN